mmetsp:Transcript_8869/g.1265  ORF Transcript_8869/g.1265 Transcript_8869/m.1265 type:complete len:89 (+) Transcript_8869:2464-2730(+)
MSDGRLDKNRVRRALRLVDPEICFVFVILDNPDSSIVKMQTTVFEGNNIKVYPFLADFPFNYYVVVQSPDLLPSTLADLLRQWISIDI